MGLWGDVVSAVGMYGLAWFRGGSLRFCGRGRRWRPGKWNECWRLDGGVFGCRWLEEIEAARVFFEEGCKRKEEMDQTVLKHMEDDEDPTMKTVKNTAIGLAAGSIWGAVVANLYDVPQLEKNVTRPGLMRTLKGCGSYGLEQLLVHASRATC